MLEVKILVNLVKKIERVLEKEFKEKIKNKIIISKNILFIIILDNFFLFK